MMRDDKLEGWSLRDIAERHGVSKSTVSMYCRDLYTDPRRVYETEEEAREAVIQRGHGRSHSKYHPCVDCGKSIRNEYTRCEDCNQVEAWASGKMQRFIDSGDKAREIRWGSHRRAKAIQN